MIAWNIAIAGTRVRSLYPLHAEVWHNGYSSGPTQPAGTSGVVLDVVADSDTYDLHSGIVLIEWGDESSSYVDLLDLWDVCKLDDHDLGARRADCTGVHMPPYCECWNGNKADAGYDLAPPVGNRFTDG